jgi:hypothetical protein
MGNITQIKAQPIEIAKIEDCENWRSLPKRIANSAMKKTRTPLKICIPRFNNLKLNGLFGQLSFCSKNVRYEKGLPKPLTAGLRRYES